MRLANKSPVVNYLTRHPNVKVILVYGHDKMTAMRALATVLSQEFTVGVGVNPNLEEVPNIVLLDGDTAEHLLGSVPAARFNGDAKNTDCIFEVADFSLKDGYVVDFVLGDERLRTNVRLLGEYNLQLLANVVGVANIFGVPREDIVAGIEQLIPSAGRLCPREGLEGSLIIDDSADRSNWSVETALKTVYSIDSPARILIVGGLNRDLWPFLSATLLSEVMVLGKADTELLALANKAGLKISEFNDELSLLEHLRKRLEPEAVVLLEIPLPI